MPRKKRVVAKVYYIQDTENMRVRTARKGKPPDNALIFGSKDRCLEAQFTIAEWRKADARWLRQKSRWGDTVRRAAPAFMAYARAGEKKHLEARPVLDLSKIPADPPPEPQHYEPAPEAVSEAADEQETSVLESQTHF